MDEIERITVSLPLTDELREALDGGEFPTADAAVEAAVESWTTERMIERIGVERLRRHWDEGLASGDPQPLDLRQFRKEMRARLAEVREKIRTGA